MRTFSITRCILFFYLFLFCFPWQCTEDNNRRTNTMNQSVTRKVHDYQLQHFFFLILFYDYYFFLTLLVLFSLPAQCGRKYQRNECDGATHFKYFIRPILFSISSHTFLSFYLYLKSTEIALATFSPFAYPFHAYKIHFLISFFSSPKE